ncbi:MAG: DUF4276 family protein [Deltaproteobacteria bacterium]|nr:DUF4276 family protein [Deltaproteobacteria bacterium]
MNRITINIIVEGQTEQHFVKTVLAPYMSAKGIDLYASILGKPGHKGGNVSFKRVKKHIEIFLKQRQDTYISTMLDYFKIDSDWTGKAEAEDRIKGGLSVTAEDKANILENATFKEIEKDLSDYNVKKRFIPYFSMYEFEALLFSDANILAEKTNIKVSEISKILKDYKDNPEEIDEEPAKAPGKRLIALMPGYRKIAMGKTVAEAIGIEDIRKKCFHFNGWLQKLEDIKVNN